MGPSLILKISVPYLTYDHITYIGIVMVVRPNGFYIFGIFGIFSTIFAIW